MDKKAMLEKKLYKIQNALYKIEQEELDNLILPKAKKLVGKCFRYRNTYGGSEPREVWWLYKKITSIGYVTGDNTVSVYVNMFQKDCDGKIMFQQDTVSYKSLGNDGYIRISQKKYNTEKKKLIRIMDSL